MNSSYDTYYSTSSSAQISGGAALAIFAGMLLLCFGAAYVCARIARNKGYSFGLFFTLSVFFGVITWIVLACLPRKQPTPLAPTATMVDGTSFTKA